MIGIGFKTDKTNEIIDLFEWTEKETFELNRLSVSGANDNINFKKYKHIAYLSEFAYGLAIAPADNISGNPGVEWQLKYYGN